MLTAVLLLSSCETVDNGEEYVEERTKDTASFFGEEIASVDKTFGCLLLLLLLLLLPLLLLLLLLLLFVVVDANCGWCGSRAYCLTCGKEVPSSRTALESDTTTGFLVLAAAAAAVVGNDLVFDGVQVDEIMGDGSDLFLCCCFCC